MIDILDIFGLLTQKSMFYNETITSNAIIYGDKKTIKFWSLKEGLNARDILEDEIPVLPEEVLDERCQDG